MNWFRLYKQATVDFAPKGWAFDDRNETILDLCYGMLYILFEKYNEINHTMIQPDGDDFDKPIGTINFYISQFIPEIIPELIQDAKNALKQLGADTDEHVQIDTFQEYIDKHNLAPDQQQNILRENKPTDPRVARLKVIRNHNIEALEMKKLFKLDAPPTINMTGSNSNLIIKSVLGFRDFENEIGAAELKQKIEEKLPRLQEIRKTMTPEQAQEENIDYILQRLEQFQKLADWCVEHNYPTIICV